jgi:hypothetical protein
MSANNLLEWLSASLTTGPRSWRADSTVCVVNSGALWHAVKPNKTAETINGLHPIDIPRAIITQLNGCRPTGDNMLQCKKCHRYVSQTEDGLCDHCSPDKFDNDFENSR